MTIISDFITIWSEFDLAIVGAIVGAIVYVLSEKGVRYISRKNPFKSSVKFWTHWIKGDALIICSTTGEREPTLTRGTGSFDCISFQRLSSCISEVAPGKSPTSIIEQYTYNWMDKNIIAIGGRVNNHVTEEIFEKTSGLAYTFNDKLNIIERIDDINKEVRKPPRPGDGSFDNDSGLLTHLPHPFSPEKHVLIIAGCWGQGTLGGVNLLINEVDEIWKKTKDNFFQVVYDVQIDSNQNPINEKIDWESLQILHPKATPPNWKDSLRNYSDQFKKEISIVIPCKNEENTVANIVKIFKGHKAVGEIIVIDNGSTDKTSKNAEEAGATVISEVKQGKGYALKAGIQYCQYPFIFFIDGDIENPQQEWLDLLLRRLHSLSLDVVRADPHYYPPLVTICVQPFLKILFGKYKYASTIRQPLGGIILLNKEIAQTIICYDDWGVDVGLTIEVIKRNLAYDEVRIGPIIHGERPPIRIYEMSEQIIRTIIKESDIVK